MLVLIGRCPGSREYLRALGRLRRPAGQRSAALQPGQSTAAQSGVRARRGAGDPPPPVGRSRITALRRDGARRVRGRVRVVGEVPGRSDRTSRSRPIRARWSATWPATPMATTVNRSAITTSSATSSAARACSRCAVGAQFALLCIPAAGARARRRHEHLAGGRAAVPRAARDADRRFRRTTGPTRVAPSTACAAGRSTGSDALMYFPRILAQDRLRGRSEPFATCGAVAGMLARRDKLMPVWQDQEGEATALRPSLRPAVPLSEVERLMLANHGVNTFGPTRWRCLAATRAAQPGCHARRGGGAPPARWPAPDAADRRERRTRNPLGAVRDRRCRAACPRRSADRRAAGRLRCRRGIRARAARLLRHLRRPAERSGHRPARRIPRPVRVRAASQRRVPGVPDHPAGPAAASRGRSRFNRLATVGERVEIEIQTSILRGPRPFKVAA